MHVSSGEDFLVAVENHFNTYGPIKRLLVFSHGGTHALYLHQKTSASNSLYVRGPAYNPGSGGRYFDQLNPKYFASHGYACLYACKTAGDDWGAAASFAKSVGKGFLVEGNTVGLNFTGVNGGAMGQGLPARIPANYSGNVFLQDTSKSGKWTFYRGN